MLIRKRHVSLLFLAVVLWPGPASAFQTQGYRWGNNETQPVVYRLEPNGSADVTDGTELEALRRAFNTWEEVSCSFLKFQEGEWVEPKALNNDGNNRIFWVENQNEWPGQAGTLALTYTFYTLDGSERITDADMIINGVNWTWTTVDAEVGTGSPAKVDVETIVFHEIGHFFGLDHSSDPGAAMYPSNNKLMQRVPAQDDVNAICSLYPNGQNVPDINGGNKSPVGAACTTGDTCASSLCVEDALVGRNYCTATCTPGNTSTCPAGYLCEMTQSGTAYCFLPAPVDELCDLCSDGNQCGSGLCLTVPNVNDGRPFCSQACDPTPGQPQQCPNGYQCTRTQTGQSQIGACVPNSGLCNPTGKGGQGEVCYANGTCKAGHQCVAYYDDLSFCYALCPVAAAGQSCGSPRTTCVALVDQPQIAVCLPVARETEPCVPEVCDDLSFCAWGDPGIDSALCYRLCPGGQTNCAENTQCKVYEGLPAVCEPNEGYKLDGEPCLSDASCASNTCRTFGANRLCTRACATTSPGDCTSGTRCVAEPGTEQGLCWPTLYTDPDARDPTRTSRTIPATYCSCDSSNECDEDCECDPECEGSSCSCRSVPGESTPWAAALLVVVSVARRRRR